MANDITGINSNRTQLSTNQSAVAKSRNEAKPGNNSSEESPAAAAGDRVSLTSTASRLKDIEQQLNKTSPVDGDRVAAMQSAISNGEYKVDADKVADKMLAFEDFMSR